MEKEQTYWDDLLEQYIDGSISREDRYALEKRALDDPFLFDALEGYHQMGTKLDTQFLDQIPKVQKVNKSNPMRWIWLPVAASLLLLLAVSTLMNDNFESNQLESVLVDSSPESRRNNNKLAASQVRKSENDETEVQANDEVLQPRATSQRERKDEGLISDVDDGKDQLMSDEKPSKDKMENDSDRTASKVAENVKSKTDYQAVTAGATGQRSEQFDKEGIDVPPVGTELAQEVISEEVVLDESDIIMAKNESSNEQVDDYLENVPSSKSGAVEKEAAPVYSKAKSKKVLVTPSQSKEMSNAYDTAGYGESSGDEAYTFIRYDGNLYASKGKSWFQKYFLRETKSLRKETDYETGKVVLKFFIDDDNEIVDINVVSASCTHCASKAISILKESGKWEKIGKNGPNSTTLIMNFGNN